MRARGRPEVRRTVGYRKGNRERGAPRKHRGDAARALAVLVLALAGCSGGTPMGVPLKARSNWDAEWHRYLDFTPWKCLAVAGDPKGRHVTGYGYAHITEPMACEDALEYCEERRVDLGVDEPCRLYAIGEEPVSSNESDAEAE